MKCPKCGSENVNVQMFSSIKRKRKGFLYWLFIGWWLEFFAWLLFFLPTLIIKIFKPKKYTSKIHKNAVCQNCGHSWKV